MFTSSSGVGAPFPRAADFGLGTSWVAEGVSEMESNDFVSDEEFWREMHLQHHQ